MELPNQETLRILVTRYAGFIAEYGDAIGEPELVAPNGDYFPDEWHRDAESVARLLRRMLSYAPVKDDLPIGIRFYEPDAGNEKKGGCSSGGCSTGGQGAAVRDCLTDTADGYLMDVNVADAGNPTLLVTTLARSIGALVLAEAGEEVDPDDLGVMSEIAAVASGFGVLLHQGSYVYGKSCGGARVHQATSLSVEELGVLLALFVRYHDLKASSARRHLDVTQKEAFDCAMEWVDANESLVAALRDRPAEVAEGYVELSPVRGIFGRLFGGGKPKPRDEEDAADEVVRAAQARVSQRSPEEQRRIDEMRALVDEALSSSAGGEA
jgi:hypothetical protein